MAHQQGRGSVEAIHQQPAFVVDGETERATDAAHSSFAKPVFGHCEELAENIGMVFRFQHAEKAGCVRVPLQVQLIELGGDSTHHSIATKGEPRTPCGVLEVGVVGRQMLAAFQQQGWDPRGIGPVEPPGHPDESVQVTPALHPRHVQGGGEPVAAVGFVGFHSRERTLGIRPPLSPGGPVTLHLPWAKNRRA